MLYVSEENEIELLRLASSSFIRARWASPYVKDKNTLSYLEHSVQKIYFSFSSS